MIYGEVKMRLRVLVGLRFQHLSYKQLHSNDKSRRKDRKNKVRRGDSDAYRVAHELVAEGTIIHNTKVA